MPTTAATGPLRSTPSRARVETRLTNNLLDREDDDRTHDHEQDVYREANQKKVEGEQRAFPDALARPWAVMIEVVDAHLALVAVPSFVRSHDVAPSTAVDVSCVLLPCLSVHDARV